MSKLVYQAYSIEKYTIFKKKKKKLAFNSFPVHRMGQRLVIIKHKTYLCYHVKKSKIELMHTRNEEEKGNINLSFGVL